MTEYAAIRQAIHTALCTPNSQKCIRGFLVLMRYINSCFTYLLTDILTEFRATELKMTKWNDYWLVAIGYCSPEKISQQLRVFLLCLLLTVTMQSKQKSKSSTVLALKSQVNKFVKLKSKSKTC